MYAGHPERVSVAVSAQIVGVLPASPVPQPTTRSKWKTTPASAGKPVSGGDGGDRDDDDKAAPARLGHKFEEHPAERRLTENFPAWTHKLLAVHLGVHTGLADTMAPLQENDRAAVALRREALRSISKLYSTYDLRLSPTPADMRHKHPGHDLKPPSRHVFLHNLLPRKEFVTLSTQCLKKFTRGPGDELKVSHCFLAAARMAAVLC